jgi:uncharacterized protein YjbI with pentapeptide repeats
MNAFHRLSRFGGTVKKRASPVWKSAKLQFERGLQWLRRKRRPVALVIVGCVLLYLCLPYGPQVWSAYKSDPDTFTPFFTPVAALLVGLAAFGQWRTARLRHEEQTNADRQRRITESFSKAIEQLGSDKLEVRLGGIYSMERISKESPDDYWTVMENLAAFVRERSRRNEATRTSQDLEQRVSRRAYFLWREADRPDGRDEDFWAKAVELEGFGDPPAADIAAVLTVIKRRSERSRRREGTNDWRFDFSNVVLRQADLAGTYLEGANLWGAHLEGADLGRAHLERADLADAHLEGVSLADAHLEGANLWGAHLEGADLGRAHLEGASLTDAHLEGASLAEAHLEGESLLNAHLEGASLADAHLEGADLRGAHLEGASLKATHLHLEIEGAVLDLEVEIDGVVLGGAHLEGADLSYADGLLEAQLAEADGDAGTQLPEGMIRPARWPTTDIRADSPKLRCQRKIEMSPHAQSRDDTPRIAISRWKPRIMRPPAGGNSA